MTLVQDVRVPLPVAFNHEAALRYLGARALKGVEHVERGAYARVVAAAGGPQVVTFAFSARTAQLDVRVCGPSSLSAGQLASLARTLFDLDRDLVDIEQTLSSDDRLKPLVERQRGIRIPGTTDPFELAVRAILGQQVSVSRAAALAAKLAASHGVRLERHVGGLTHSFPSATTLSECDLGGHGIPRQRANAVRELARRVAHEEIDFTRARDTGTLTAELAEIRGIGPWTANYVALRGFLVGDAIPLSDLGLRSAMSRTARPHTTAELARIVDTWRPWRGYGAIHLWTGLLARAALARESGASGPRAKRSSAGRSHPRDLL